MITREQAVRKIHAMKVGQEITICGTAPNASKITFFRIDEDEFKVYPDGTTDLDDGAFFVDVKEVTFAYLLHDFYEVMD